MENIEVVVIGGLHHNMLGVVRALGQKGVKRDSLLVILVGESIPQKNIFSCSKYTKDIIYVRDDSLIVDALLKLSSDGKRRVVICCSDGSATCVMSHAEKLKPFFYTPSTKESIDQLMDKSFQTRIAQECGLDIPESAVIRKTDQVEWNIYPCIIKPIKSVLGGGKNDVLISQTREELVKNLKKISAEFVQVQRYIKKEIEYQLIGCSVNAGEKCIIPGFTNIIRQPCNTNTGYLRYSPISENKFDISKVERFIKRIGYSGLFSVEFIRAADGKDYFLEINMRNDGNAYCVTAAGVNLPYLWLSYCANGCLPPNEPTHITKSVLLIPDFSDISLGIKTEGLFKWMHQMWSADCHTVWNAYDKGPFLCDMKNFLIRNIKKTFARFF